MRHNRTFAIGAGLALAAFLVSGCILQIVKLVTINLGTLSAVNGAASAGLYVNLPLDNSTYRDYKNKFANIQDVAVLGTFKNNLGTAVSADVYLVRTPAGSPLLPNLTAVTDPPANGIKVWSVALAANETKTLTWDNSAALFTSAGKVAITAELMDDGIFALYVFGDTGTYNITVTGGSFDVMIGTKL
jgi:hypothetical protein